MINIEGWFVKLAGQYDRCPLPRVLVGFLMEDFHKFSSQLFTAFVVGVVECVHHVVIGPLGVCPCIESWSIGSLTREFGVFEEDGFRSADGADDRRK